MRVLYLPSLYSKKHSAFREITWENGKIYYRMDIIPHRQYVCTAETKHYFEAHILQNLYSIWYTNFKKTGCIFNRSWPLRHSVSVKSVTEVLDTINEIPFARVCGFHALWSCRILSSASFCSFFSTCFFIGSNVLDVVSGW